ncbi:unnamed protein product [Effrenium voratum]|nr:unnamed protein product [Effrenium voratum]
MASAFGRFARGFRGYGLLAAGSASAASAARARGDERLTRCEANASAAQHLSQFHDHSLESPPHKAGAAHQHTELPCGGKLVLSADCGGTTSRLMLYCVDWNDPVEKKKPAPGQLIQEQKYPNIAFKSLQDIIKTFLFQDCALPEGSHPTVAVLAVAGVVINNQTEATERLAGHPPRTKTFNIGGEFFYFDGTPHRWLPWAPPRYKVFELYFFKELYENLSRKAMSVDVPLVALRNMSCKLMDGFQLPGALDVNFFGDLQKKFCTWSDVQDALIKDGHPTITLSNAERVYLTLCDEDSCRLATGWFYFVMLVTLANLAAIVFPDCAERTCDVVGLDNAKDSCTSAFKTFCIMIFSLDYFTKLFLAPCVRMEVMHTAQKIFSGDEWTVQPLSPWQRLTFFVNQGDNRIDLIAILPFWLNVLCGRFLPTASFLRVVRLTRLFRIFKSARYFDMVHVLGLTLWKSMSMVGILFVLITIIGLIAGCLLQEFESPLGEDAFQSVLQAWYWIFCRLISMKDTVHHAGEVRSFWGITVLATTLTLKGVLWIVPIARIKQIFSAEYTLVVNDRELRKQMVDELLHLTGSVAQVSSRDPRNIAAKLAARLHLWAGQQLSFQVATGFALVAS